MGTHHLSHAGKCDEDRIYGTAFFRLRELASRSRTLVELFARMLAWLFGRYGLVLLDSHDPELRKLEVPIMEQIVRRSELLAAHLVEGSRAVQSLGYQVQAEAEPMSANLFFIRHGERELLIRDGDRFTDRNGTNTWSVDELVELVHSSPQLFSNNVLTRPLVQEYLLPVGAVIVGRSEAAYWAQLREAFHLLEMKMPPFSCVMNIRCLRKRLPNIWIVTDLHWKMCCTGLMTKKKRG